MSYDVSCLSALYCCGDIANKEGLTMNRELILYHGSIQMHEQRNKNINKASGEKSL